MVSSADGRHLGGPAPLTLTLDLIRAANAADPYEFVFAPQTYLLRGKGGSIKETTLRWDQSLIDDLASLRRSRDPEVTRRIGRRLRSFLSATQWPVLEAELSAAVTQQRPVAVTIRAAAAELYVLPWELLTLEVTGQHLGELPEVLLRYEWPETEAIPRREPPAQGCRLLLAWSGRVPADRHQAAIARACLAGSVGFDPDDDVLPHASLGRLSETLRASTTADRPVAILHLLCHGGIAGRSSGLVLDGDEPGDGAVVIDAAQLRRVLAPHAATLRLVVLAACDSGDAGIGNQIGSIAQDLHRAGIAGVIASRFPLSIPGSNRLAETLYQTLLGPSTLEAAFLAARRDLATTTDWASLQLYARADSGDTGLVGGSLEHLRAPRIREQLSQFRAVFSGARRQIALLGSYKAFHDVLQELEVPFHAIERDRRRLLASRETWDELRDPLESLQQLLDRTLQVLADDRLKGEFDMSRRRLTEAASALGAAIAHDSPRLDNALLHIQRVLSLDMSSANNRLLATARELGLGEVVVGLRSVLENLQRGTNRASFDELVRLTASLHDLHTSLDQLVREHDQWQEIANNLRHLVVGGPAVFDEALASWPLVRDGLETVRRAGGDADWTQIIDAAGEVVDADLERGAGPVRCIASLRSLWRRCNQRFVDVDRQLLRTCEELRRVGDTLDTVLRVIDER
jgi:hypothetical protein